MAENSSGQLSQVASRLSLEVVIRLVLGVSAKRKTEKRRQHALCNLIGESVLSLLGPISERNK